VLPQLQREGDYWFPYTVSMSDAQAANLGWQADKAQEHTHLH